MWLPYVDVVILSVPNVVMKLIHTQYLEYLEQCIIFGAGCVFETFAGVLWRLLKTAVHCFGPVFKRVVLWHCL